MTYRVSITNEKSPLAVPVVVLYSGFSYSEAFDAAVKARAISIYRKKWIKFDDEINGVVKWAQVS